MKISSKSYIDILYFWWILICVFGNNFIKFNILKLNPLYMIIILSYIIISYLLCTNRLRLHKHRNDLIVDFSKLYIVLSVIYISASLIFSQIGGLPGFFGITNIDYNSSYIIRQAFPIIIIPVVICQICFLKKINNLPYNVNKVYGVFIFLTIMDIFNITDHPIYRLIIVVIVTYLILFSKSRAKWICMIVALVRIGFSSSSCVIGVIVIIFIFIFRNRIVSFFNENFSVKLFLIFSIAIVVIPFASDILFSIVENDGNSEWRLAYWLNEGRIIYKTFGIGVGFGTAYADLDLFSQINNSNVFLREEYGYNMREALFIITQHSSILNQFYRMGIIGGVLFLIINLYVSKSFAIEYSSSKSELRKKLLLCTYIGYAYNFIFIAFNPGLESPRFCFGFIVSLGSVLGIIFNKSMENN